MDETASEEIGAVVAERYRLEALLGEGGHGRVWAAVDLAETPPRPVALKLLQLEVRSNAHLRFVREARALQTLRHPAIVAALDAGVWAGVPYLVLERVRGRTLTEELLSLCAARREGTLDVGAYRARAERWISTLAEALAHVHRAGLVHRDVKPSNVMVDEHDDIKLLDFGSIRDLQADTEDATTLGRTLYSNVFFAPEQLLGQPVEPAADLFVFTSLVFVLTTLSMPWVEDDLGRPVSFEKRLGYGERFGARAVLARMTGRPPSVEHRPLLSAVLAEGWVLDPAVRGADVVGLAARWRDAVHTEGLDLGAVVAREASEIRWARAWAAKLQPMPVRRESGGGTAVVERLSALETQLVGASGLRGPGLDAQTPADPAESGAAPLTLTKTKPVAVRVAATPRGGVRAFVVISAMAAAVLSAALWRAGSVPHEARGPAAASADSVDAQPAWAPGVVARAATATQVSASMAPTITAPVVAVAAVSTSASTSSAAATPDVAVGLPGRAASPSRRARRADTTRSESTSPTEVPSEIAGWRARLERGELSLSQTRELARAALAELANPVMRQSLSRDLDAAYIQLDRAAMSEVLVRLERALAP